MTSGTMLVVNGEVQVPLREFEFSYSRSGGPGGQNVNKLNTKATLRWAVLKNTSMPEEVRRRFTVKFGKKFTVDGDLLIVSQRFRDAGRNTADCLEKLRQMLFVAAVRPKHRRPTKPTKASVHRRLDVKRRKSTKKRMRGEKELDARD
jgi:ribosome-associated protein